MVESEYFTDRQEEKFYAVTWEDSEEEIAKNVNLFFCELSDRRRNDSAEEGLQACIVILPDRCAMKVCENDGSGSYLNSFINLVKYLNGDNNYISASGTGKFKIYKKERNQLYSSGVSVRILDGEEFLKLIIESFASDMSNFQLGLLNKILLASKVWKDNEMYRSVEVGFNTCLGNFNISELSDDYYDKLVSVINSARDKMVNKSSLSR